jgi:hypothetical protein
LDTGALSLDQMRTGLMLSGQRWDNAKAIAAFNSGSAEQWADFVGKMSKEGDHLSSEAAKLASMKADRDMQRDIQERTLQETIRNHMAETLRKDKDRKGEDLKLIEGNVRNRLYGDPVARPYLDAGVIPPDNLVRAAVVEADKVAEQRAASVQLLAAGVPQRTPVETMRRIEDIDVAQGYVDEIKRLIPSVRLDKVVGGLRPVLNEKIQTGRLGFIPLPESVTKQLTPDENRFLSLVQDYADSILRVRSGAAITEGEMKRMVGFIPEQSATPQAFLARLDLQRDLLQSRREIIRNVTSESGYRVPPASQAPLGAPSSPSSATPSTATVRIRRKSDGKILEGSGDFDASKYERVK